MEIWTYLRALSLATLVAASLASTPALGGEAKRQKVIDFDDELVEGVNKRPLDSLAHVSENGKKRKKPHLYRKRNGFRGETSETLRLLRDLP